jgi:hypothetical protein
MEGAMADDKTKRRPQDSSRISTTEKYEVDYWSKKFKVTPTTLKNAVKTVGPSAKKVKEYLSK